MRCFGPLHHCMTSLCSFLVVGGSFTERFISEYSNQINTFTFRLELLSELFHIFFSPSTHTTTGGERDPVFCMVRVPTGLKLITDHEYDAGKYYY